MNAAHGLRVQLHGAVPVSMGQTLVAVRKAEHGPDLVVMEQAEHHRPDDVVQSRAQPSAGDDAAFQLERVEVDFLPRAGFFECQYVPAFLQGALDRGRVRLKDDMVYVVDKVGPGNGRLNPTRPQPLNTQVFRLQFHDRSPVTSWSAQPIS